jgi:hypothetical protein
MTRDKLIKQKSGYVCSKCQCVHRNYSKIGKEHIFFTDHRATERRLEEKYK